MNNSQRKAGEEAAFIAQLMCCLSNSHYAGPPHPTEMWLGNFTKPPNWCTFGNDVSTRHSVERKNQEALTDNLLKKDFSGIYQFRGPMRHDPQESSLSIRSNIFVIKTFSFITPSLRWRRCHHHRWLCFYKVYLRCIFNLGTKSGSVLLWSIHRSQHISYTYGRYVLGLRLCM